MTKILFAIVALLVLASSADALNKRTCSHVLYSSVNTATFTTSGAHFLTFNTESGTGTTVTPVQSAAPYEDIKVKVNTNDLINLASNTTYSFSGPAGCSAYLEFFQDRTGAQGAPYSLTLGASNSAISDTRAPNVGENSDHEYELVVYILPGTSGCSVTISAATLRVAYTNGC